MCKGEEIIKEAREEKRNWLLENEAEELLEIYGIKVPPRDIAKTLEEGKKIASRLGYPVAIKILSPQILHKSDVGGVRTGIESGERLAKEWEDMLKTVGERVPSYEFRGILIQKMAPPGGTEIIIGGMRDDTFGPVVMFGLGGIWVEVMEDVTFRVAPIDQEEARKMIEDIRGKKILYGVRGEKTRDIPSLARTISLVSRILDSHPSIKEIDLNPVFVYEKGLLCVDARITLT